MGIGIQNSLWVIFVVLWDVQKLTHSQIAAKRLRIEDIDEVQRLPMVVVVDNVRSLYNVGSIFRTSDGILIERLVLSGFTPHPPRKEIEKTALGATKSVPWEYVKSPVEALKSFRARGYTIACLELADTSIPYFEFPRKDFPLCLVIGNEIVGVSKEIVSLSDVALEIPMVGVKQSLNVAVAYGIAAFELARIYRSNQNARVK
jgi:tRNA G18 (ribose-2'-O)-methylase SpoU